MTSPFAWLAWRRQRLAHPAKVRAAVTGQIALVGCPVASYTGTIASGSIFAIGRVSMDSSSPNKAVRIPPIVWVLLAIVPAGLGGVLFLQVPMDQAVTYGLIALMIVAHFFMHGGHGSHGAHDHRGESRPDAGGADAPDDTSAHRGGCH